MKYDWITLEITSIGRMDDIGYVRLVDSMGTDLTVVNAARISFEKKKETLEKDDEKLIFFLAEHKHMSPFRHAHLSFEVYAPLVVARQWWKHCIGSEFTENSPAWNESSRRYVKENNMFYVPDQWRLQNPNIKQGSSDEISPDSKEFSEKLVNHIKESERLYIEALDKKICIEQARFFLPAYSLYIRFVWTASLQAVSHFIKLRKDPTAQKEIRDYAIEVEKICEEKFPTSMKALGLF